MSKENRNSTSGGVGFCGLLAIVFIVLKLTGHIAWSWWWVLSPLWTPFAVFVGFLVVSFVLAFLWAIVKR